MKNCSKCKENKELDAFCKAGVDKNGNQRIDTICKDCRAKDRLLINRKDYSKEYDSSDFALNQKYIRKGFKINGEQFTTKHYNEIIKKQNFKCACCETKNPGGKGNKRFVVDHCHLTGEFRGLLCVKCNRSIGGLGDSEEGLNKAINYLKNCKIKIVKNEYRKQII